MIETCSMCNKRYEVNPDDECYLENELPICCHCGDMLDALINNQSEASYHSARKYIVDKYDITTNMHVKSILRQVLIDNQINENKSNDPFLNKADDQYSSFSAASGKDLPYVVYQVTLKEKFFGTGSGNLGELESIINHFYNKGYRLHTLSTTNSDSKGIAGGDRIQATLVFEKLNLFN